MNAVGMCLYHALVMAWETFWALAFGFTVSAGLQVFVSKERMTRAFGETNLKTIGLATIFGAASSSCSYAATAAARSAFRQGATLTLALAFMFASTNLVAELGVVLCILLGWQFLAANILGAFVLIALLWLFSRWFLSPDLEVEARRHVEGSESDDHCCGHDHAHEHTHDGETESKWRQVADAFVVDWSMLWKEITIGFLLAGFLATLVPPHWWSVLFLQSGPEWLRILENCAVGPLIAMASFVCSVGNIPLAAHLWSSGLSFGGVISFIFGDLIIIPLILIYRKQYGGRVAAFITVIFYLCMVLAGVIVDLAFAAAGLIPSGPRPPSPVMEMSIRWNYTSWLDLIALALTLWFFSIHWSGKGEHAHR